MNGFKVILSWPEKNLYMGHSPNRLEQQPVKLKVPGSSPGCPANSFNLRVKIRFDLVVNITIPSDLGDIGI